MASQSSLKARTFLLLSFSLDLYKNFTKSYQSALYLGVVVALIRGVGGKKYVSFTFCHGRIRKTV